MSESFETAVAEYEQELGIRPGTFCAYDVDVDSVADLTDPSVLQDLGIDEADLQSRWKSISLVQRREPPTWRLATELIRLGCRGVRVPSSRVQGGINLVLWRWNDDPNGRVQALDPLNELSRSPSE